MSYKHHQCKACGHSKEIQTNHWGECYSLGNYNRCPSCGPLPPNKRRPQAVQYPITTWVCQETPPEGYGKPEPWKQVTLGDVAEIVIPSNQSPS
jgi:hypothetical protein